MDVNRMWKVRITVLKTTLNEDLDLVSEYGADGLTACPMLNEGASVLR